MSGTGYIAQTSRSSWSAEGAAGAYREGYEAMRTNLDYRLQQELDREPLSDLPSQRTKVREIALQASHEIQRGEAFEHAGPAYYQSGVRLEYREFETGMRKATMDWSHEHNHALLQQIGGPEQSANIQYVEWVTTVVNSASETQSSTKAAHQLDRSPATSSIGANRAEETLILQQDVGVSL
jgi:hypothetical protein